MKKLKKIIFFNRSILDVACISGNYKLVEYLLSFDEFDNDEYNIFFYYKFIIFLYTIKFM